MDTQRANPLIALAIAAGFALLCPAQPAHAHVGLAVTFDNIGINSLMQLTSGEVKVVRNALNLQLFGDTPAGLTAKPPARAELHSVLLADLSEGVLKNIKFADNEVKLVGSIDEIVDYEVSGVVKTGKLEVVEVGGKKAFRVSGNVGEFTTQQIDDYVTLATKNGEQNNKVMFGEYIKNDPNSYHIRAKNENYTYFDMDEKWDEAKKLVDNGVDESWKAEMWKINKAFIDKQKALGKEFYFSHEPWLLPSKTFRSKEAEYLIDIGAKDFQKINSNTWKVIW